MSVPRAVATGLTPKLIAQTSALYSLSVSAAIDLSKVEGAVAYVEGMRAAESRHANGRLKTPKEFIAELESWEG